jgi:hypothetical protein
VRTPLPVARPRQAENRVTRPSLTATRNLTMPSRQLKFPHKFFQRMRLIVQRLRRGRRLLDQCRVLLCVDRARKAGILPLPTPSTNISTASIEALIVPRNDLSHGASDIHSPGMALQVIDACAFWINHVYSPQSGWATKFEYFVSVPGTLTSCGHRQCRSSTPDKPSRQSLDDLHDHLPILAGNPVE